jgi:16S rRNA (cytosine1402-N4)-methyltransferase
LEDRRVKQFFQSLVHPLQPPHPLAPAVPPKARSLIRKPVLPSEEELFRNPRSRSAKLRAIEKL